MDEPDQTAPPGDETARGEEAESGRAAPNDRRPTWWVPWLIALVAAVGAGVIFFTTDDADGEDLRAARDVATRFGAAYLSFDAGSVAAAEADLLALTTDRFGQEFAEARLPSVEELFAGSETSTRSDVTDVFTTAIDQDRVRALVFVDVFASTPAGEQELRNLSFVLELRREGSRWKVDDVGPLPIPEVVGGLDAAPTPPTSTTSSTSTTSLPDSSTTDLPDS